MFKLEIGNEVKNIRINNTIYFCYGQNRISITKFILSVTNVDYVSVRYRRPAISFQNLCQLKLKKNRLIDSVFFPL